MMNDKLDQLKILAGEAQVLADELAVLARKSEPGQQPSSDIPWPQSVAFDPPPPRADLIAGIAAMHGVTEAVAESWLMSAAKG